MHSSSIIRQHPSVIPKNTCGVWKHRRFSCILTKLLGDIVVGESLVGGVIMVVIVTDGRVAPIVYEIPRLECDTHGVCEFVLVCDGCGGDVEIAVGRGFNEC